MPRLRLVAGPNGSGKTTFTKELIEKRIPLGQYLNPDDIAKHINLHELVKDPRLTNKPFRKDIQSWGNEDVADLATIIAQKVAVGLRSDWSLDGLSLTYESVMSDPSHIKFAHDAKMRGFDVYLYYICTSSSDLNLERVAQRVQSGGHSVPHQKVHDRYRKSLAQLHDMLKHCHRAYFFDNSDKQFVHFAETTPDGYLDIEQRKFGELDANWFVESVLTRWSKNKVRLASW